MLSETEIAYIRENGWMVDHDWEVFACILGEPFMVNQYLCYWDGDNLSICSWLIDRTINSSDSLSEAVQDCIRLFSPKTIQIWGPYNIQTKTLLPNYKRIAIKVASKENVDLQIKFSEYQKPDRSHFYKQALKLENKGVNCRIKNGEVFTFQHYNLLNSFLHSHSSLRLFDKVYITLSTLFSHTPKTRMFQAYRDEELLGYILVREVFRKVVIGTWGIYKKEPHISDYLYAKMIEHYQESSIEFLDLGYSVHKNLLMYKTKWNTNINYGSFYNCTYSDQDIDGLDNYSWCWFTRSLIKPFNSTQR